MLFFHDVCPGSGWAPGLHFTLSSLVDPQPGPSPASDQLVVGGGQKSPLRTCDHTHAAHSTPGRCTPPLQPLGEAPEWPLRGPGQDLEDVGGESRAPPWKPRWGWPVWLCLVTCLYAGATSCRARCAQLCCTGVQGTRKEHVSVRQRRPTQKALGDRKSVV